MPIFESDARRKAGTRSNTKLFVSGGAAPAEEWITDPNLDTLFMYDYGGAGQKDVVLSKGSIVGIKPENIESYEKGVGKGALTFAGKDSAPAIGMAPYNFTKNHDDFFDGNQPSIITREYIELPLFTNKLEAAQVKWGAAYGDPSNGGDLKNGDYVTFSRDADNFGKIIKYNPDNGHEPHEIIGQVLATELDQEPWGWLKWALWDETARREDQGPQNKSGYDAPGQAGYPYDPDYKDGVIDADGYLSQYTTNPTGIPGILDGENKAQTVQEVAFDSDGEKETIVLNKKNIVDGSVQFDTTGGALSMTEVASKGDVDAAGKFFVDYANGKVTYQTDGAQSGRITFSAHFFGTPAGWDFKGAVGAVRILLKF